MQQDPALRVSAAILALGAVLLTSACGDGEESAALGDQVQGRIGDLEGAEHSVLVPTGELTVTVTDGQEMIGAREAADGQEHQAPSGTTWVGLD